MPNILRPLHSYFEQSSGKHLSRASRAQLASDVFEDIASRYEASLSKMKKDTDALRRLKKGRVGGGLGFSSLFSGGSGSSAGSAAAAKAGEDAKAGQSSEDENVKRQMAADVEAFAKDAESLGVVLQESNSLKALRAIVDDWLK